MELRKIIKFGSSSYVVSLPKTWVNKNSLGKGDFLYFNENGNSELIISPREGDKKKVLSKIAIDVANKPVHTIRRELMSAYIQNYDIIKITGNLSEIRQDIDNMLHGLLALEIMQDTPDKIVIKDFLNISDISLNEIMKRMDVMVRAMLNDADASFEKNNYEKLNQVDKSVNKLMFLMFRVIRKGMKDPEVLKSLKVRNCTELLDYWLMTDNLEGVADDTKRVARFLKKSGLQKEELGQLRNLFQMTRESYLKLMKAFYSRDVSAAHEIGSSMDDKLAMWTEVYDKCESKIAGPLIERFKAIDGQLRTMTRVIVDRGVASEQAEH